MDTQDVSSFLHIPLTVCQYVPDEILLKLFPSFPQRTRITRRCYVSRHSGSTAVLMAHRHIYSVKGRRISPRYDITFDFTAQFRSFRSIYSKNRRSLIGNEQHSLSTFIVFPCGSFGPRPVYRPAVPAEAECTQE